MATFLSQGRRRVKLRALVRAAIVPIVCVSVPGTGFGAIDLLPKEFVVRDQTVSAEIVNNSDHAEYVSISLVRLLNPGVPPDEEKLEPIGEVSQPALYAFPFRVSLAPRQHKTITLKPLRPVDAETVYRLNVRPVIKLIGGERRDLAGSITVSLAFSALVRQLPVDERAEVSVTCDTRGARIVATGSVRYAVKGAIVDGRPVDDFNVYPGVPLPLEGRVVAVPGQPTCRGGTPS